MFFCFVRSVFFGNSNIVVNRFTTLLIVRCSTTFHEISFHPNIDYLVDRDQIQRTLIEYDSLNYFVYSVIRLNVSSF